MAARGRGKEYNGYTWIPRSWRFGIYLRDIDPVVRSAATQDSKPDLDVLLASVRCLWCLRTGVRVCLDHLTPRVNGGDDSPGNLVTSCFACNGARGSADWIDWCTSRVLLPGTVSRIEYHRCIEVTPAMRKTGMLMLKHRGRRSWRIPAMCDERRRQDEEVQRQRDPHYVHPGVVAAITDPEYAPNEPYTVDVPF
jgi:hypothetical protein